LVLLKKAVDCQFPIRVKPRDLEWLHAFMSVDRSNPLLHLIVRLLLPHPYSLRWKAACPAVFVYLRSVLEYCSGFWKPVYSVEPHENCPRTSLTQSLWMNAHGIRNPGSLVRIFLLSTGRLCSWTVTWESWNALEASRVCIWSLVFVVIKTEQLAGHSSSVCRFSRRDKSTLNPASGDVFSSEPLVPTYQTPSPQMEAPCLSETLVLAYRNTRFRNADDYNVNVHLPFHPN
jgi:hypothetical protein